MRGQFWCKFQFGVSRNLWVMGGYGILGVWVKRGSTVDTLWYPDFNKISSSTAVQPQRALILIKSGCCSCHS